MHMSRALAQGQQQHGSSPALGVVSHVLATPFRIIVSAFTTLLTKPLQSNVNEQPGCNSECQRLYFTLTTG